MHEATWVSNETFRPRWRKKSTCLMTQLSDTFTLLPAFIWFGSLGYSEGASRNSVLTTIKLQQQLLCLNMTFRFWFGAFLSLCVCCFRVSWGAITYSSISLGTSCAAASLQGSLTSKALCSLVSWALIHSHRHKNILLLSPIVQQKLFNFLAEFSNTVKATTTVPSTKKLPVVSACSDGRWNLITA